MINVCGHPVLLSNVRGPEVLISHLRLLARCP